MPKDSSLYPEEDYKNMEKSIPNSIIAFKKCKSTKVLWNSLQQNYEGCDDVKENKKDMLKKKLENFCEVNNENMASQTLEENERDMLKKKLKCGKYILLPLGGLKIS
ncbi:hypothetical protein R6Q57_022979 [Mikania cordata]